MNGYPIENKKSDIHYLSKLSYRKNIVKLFPLLGIKTADKMKLLVATICSAIVR